MPHESCITIRGQLTPEEETRVTNWIVRSLQDRPHDWSFGQHTLKDSRTGMEVWTANGSDSLGVWRPVETQRFSGKNRKALWKAIHVFRHQVGSEAFKTLNAAMADAPVPTEPKRLTFLQRIGLIEKPKEILRLPAPSHVTATVV